MCNSDFMILFDKQPMITINLNITTPAIPCALLSVDAQDIMGTHVVDVGGKLHKSRTDKDGNIKRDSNGNPLPECKSTSS